MIQQPAISLRRTTSSASPSQLASISTCPAARLFRAPDKLSISSAFAPFPRRTAMAADRRELSAWIRFRSSPTSSLRTQSRIRPTTRCRQTWRSVSLTACNCRRPTPSASRSIRLRALKTFSTPSIRDGREACHCSTPRQRFVLSYYYELPIQKFTGVAGQILNGWAVSGITQFQSGFPIHLQSFDDNELTSSIDFSSGRANPTSWPSSGSSIRARIRTTTGSIPTASPRMLPTIPRCRARRRITFNCFQPSLFGRYRNRAPNHLLRTGTQQLGLLGTEELPDLREHQRVEFRWDIFNVFNHTQVLQSGRQHH